MCYTILCTYELTWFVWWKVIIRRYGGAMVSWIIKVDDIHSSERQRQEADMYYGIHGVKTNWFISYNE